MQSKKIRFHPTTSVFDIVGKHGPGIMVTLLSSTTSYYLMLNTFYSTTAIL
jgi:hypothetical protein